MPRKTYSTVAVWSWALGSGSRSLFFLFGPVFIRTLSSVCECVLGVLFSQVISFSQYIHQIDLWTFWTVPAIAQYYYGEYGRARVFTSIFSCGHCCSYLSGIVCSPFVCSSKFVCRFRFANFFIVFFSLSFFPNFNSRSFAHSLPHTVNIYHFALWPCSSFSVFFFLWPNSYRFGFFGLLSFHLGVCFLVLISRRLLPFSHGEISTAHHRNDSVSYYRLQTRYYYILRNFFLYFSSWKCFPHSLFLVWCRQR